MVCTQKYLGHKGVRLEQNQMQVQPECVDLVLWMRVPDFIRSISILSGYAVLRDAHVFRCGIEELNGAQFRWMKMAHTSRRHAAFSANSHFGRQINRWNAPNRCVPLAVHTFRAGKPPRSVVESIGVFGVGQNQNRTRTLTSAQMRGQPLNTEIMQSMQSHVGTHVNRL